MITIGGDSHKRTHTFVAVDEVGRKVAETTVAATTDVLDTATLLDVVDSRVFVPNLDLMRGPAERRLVRMTGRIVGGGEAMSWREWWQLRRQGFVGIRSAVAVDEGRAVLAALLMARPPGAAGPRAHARAGPRPRPG